MELNNYSRIRQILKQRRKSLGLKQEDLARQLGLSAMGLSYLERGQRQLKLEHLIRWAEALDMKVTTTVEPIESE